MACGTRPYTCTSGALHAARGRTQSLHKHIVHSSAHMASGRSVRTRQSLPARRAPLLASWVEAQERQGVLDLVRSGPRLAQIADALVEVLQRGRHGNGTRPWAGAGRVRHEAVCGRKEQVRHEAGAMSQASSMREVPLCVLIGVPFRWALFFG